MRPITADSSAPAGCLRRVGCVPVSRRALGLSERLVFGDEIGPGRLQPAHRRAGLAGDDFIAGQGLPLGVGVALLRYLWAKEPVRHRLDQPLTGGALYVKNGGPTDNLTVIVNGVHRAVIPAIAQFGAAQITLPADLEILDLCLQAEGTAQARAVMLLK